MSDSDNWTICFLVFFCIFCGLVILFLLGRSLAARRTGFYAGIVVLLLSAVCLSFAFWQKNDYIRADDAIIMIPVTSVKSAPSGESSKDLFILHEGTKVKVLDQVGGWSNIELADGRQGWLQTEDMELI